MLQKYSKAFVILTIFGRFRPSLDLPTQAPFFLYALMILLCLLAFAAELAAARNEKSKARSGNGLGRAGDRG